MKKLLYILLLPLLFGAIPLFAGIEPDAATQETVGAQKGIQQYDKDSRIDFGGQDPQGANAFIILNDIQGLQDNSVVTDGVSRYSLGVTVVHGSEEQFFDVSQEISKITDFSTQMVPIGTTLHNGDKVYFQNVETKKPYSVQVMTNSGRTSSSFNTAYGVDRYYQISYGNLNYDGVIDIVLSIRNVREPMSGAPLPGALTTLLIGSVSVMFVARRRKNKAQAT